MTSPVNIGNPDEHTIQEFASLIKGMINASSKVCAIQLKTIVNRVTFQSLDVYQSIS